MGPPDPFYKSKIQYGNLFILFFLHYETCYSFNILEIILSFLITYSQLGQERKKKEKKEKKKKIR